VRSTPTSVKTGSVPARDWTTRDVLDHQFTHGVQLAPRPADSGDCCRDELLTRLADIVAEFLSRPMCQGETTMPLITLRLWIQWRMQREIYGEGARVRRSACMDDAFDLVAWALNQPHSGLVVVRVKKQRQRAAA
jgi:hypothetical protein